LNFSWKISEVGRLIKGNWITFSAGVGTTNSFVAGLGIPAGALYRIMMGRLCSANGLIQNIHMFDTSR
jgi:hypothetical protein